MASEKTNAQAYIVHKNELPGSATASTFEGYLHGNANVSFFISTSPQGHGPSLHTHPYEEVFIVQTGTLTFTVGEEEIEVNSGGVVVVPAGVPHKFINKGTEICQHIDLHISERMATTWLETDD